MSDTREYIELEHENLHSPDSNDLKRKVLKNKQFVPRSNNVFFDKVNLTHPRSK